MTRGRIGALIAIALASVGAAIAAYGVLGDGGSDDPDGEASSGQAPGTEDASTTTSHSDLLDATDSPRLDLYPDRPGRGAQDREAEPGEVVRFGPLEATVERGTSEEGRRGERLLVVFVSLRNSGDDSLPYRDVFFVARSQTNQTFSPARSGRRDALDFGQVEPGETVTGTVAFEAEPDTYFIEFQPDPFSEAKGVWRLSFEDESEP